MSDEPSRFEQLWNAAQGRGWATGVPTTGDPLSAACWYHHGVADMALAFARGHGPTLQKLEEIRAELARLADNASRRSLGEDS